MTLANSTKNYGIVARFLHWFMALCIFAMFAFGLWMVTLDLYNPWYKAAPDLHKGLGILLFALLIGRVFWRMGNIQPDNSHLRPIERHLSYLIHIGFYVLLFALMIAGYLITTVDGRSIDVFGWFSVPSIYQQKGFEEIAGFVHEMLAYGVTGLAVIHTAAACKHHFINRDVTMVRMWRKLS